MSWRRGYRSGGLTGGFEGEFEGQTWLRWMCLGRVINIIMNTQGVDVLQEIDK